MRQKGFSVMSFKRIAVFACIAVLAACSDNPEAPAEAQQQHPAGVAKDPAPVVAVPSPDDHSARFEFYFNGTLQRVFRGSDAAAPQSYGEFTGTDFRPLVEMIDKRPVNSRSARLANLLRGLDRIPVNARSDAFAERAKALTKETPHTETKLPDGTRVIEFRFDGRLAGRAVIPAPTTAAAGKRARELSVESGRNDQIARNIATGDACSGCWTEADEIYYWGIVTYLMDQSAEMDAQASDLVYSSPVAAFDVSAAGNCLKEYATFMLNSAVFTGLMAGAGMNWEGISSQFLKGSITSQTAGALKVGFVAGAVKSLQAVWSSWNAFHDCLWKNW
jgi:hypothetical protein